MEDRRVLEVVICAHFVDTEPDRLHHRLVFQCASDATPAARPRNAGPVGRHDASFRREGQDRHPENRVAVTGDPDAVLVQPGRAHPLHEVVERHPREGNRGGDVLDGLFAHVPELRPLVGVGVAVDGEDADPLVPHLGARLGRGRFEVFPVLDEVELPEALAAFLDVSAFGDHVEAEGVVLPAPDRERPGAIRT